MTLLIILIMAFCLDERFKHHLSKYKCQNINKGRSDKGADGGNENGGKHRCHEHLGSVCRGFFGFEHIGVIAFDEAAHVDKSVVGILVTNTFLDFADLQGLGGSEFGKSVLVLRFGLLGGESDIIASVHDHPPHVVAPVGYLSLCHRSSFIWHGQERRNGVSIENDDCSKFFCHFGELEVGSHIAAVGEPSHDDFVGVGPTLRGLFSINDGLELVAGGRNSGSVIVTDIINATSTSSGGDVPLVASVCRLGGNVLDLAVIDFLLDDFALLTVHEVSPFGRSPITTMEQDHNLVVIVVVGSVGVDGHVTYGGLFPRSGVHRCS